MEELKKSPPSTQQKYNKNASVFYPYNESNPFVIKCSNLPNIAGVDVFIDFIKKIGGIHGLELDDFSFNVLKVGLSEEGETDNFVILEVYNGYIRPRLIDMLHEYIWDDKMIKVTLISEADPNFHSRPTYCNPYHPNYPSYPYQYNNIYSFSNVMSSYPSYNNLTPKQTSRRSSFKSTDSRRSSKNESTGLHNTKPVPHFLLNLVSGNTSTDFETENSESDSDPTNHVEVATIKDEDGNDVKVNLCRLFVGNVPYTSTWPALKNFIISICEKMEPGNNIRLLKVEIPVQSNSNIQPILQNNPIQASKYPYMPSYTNNYKYTARSLYGVREDISFGKSRGFAIVTTADQESSSKIIKYLDNAIFERRTLTVRYDKFPDFNKYTIQQLYPYNNSKMNNNAHVLSCLAFERNSFQKKFYYENNSQLDTFQNPFLFYRFMNNNAMNTFINPASFSHPYLSTIPPIPYPPNDERGMYNYSNNQIANNVPHFNESKQVDSIDNNSQTIDSHKNQFSTSNSSEIDDDKKARDLVNSLSSFKLAS